VISVLALLVLMGTVVDMFVMSRVRDAEKIDAPVNSLGQSGDGKGIDILFLNGQRYEPSATASFLAEFSALRTLRRTFTMKQKNTHETFPFLNGIRVLALFWVIIGHSLVFSLSYSSNPLDLISWTRNVFFQLIINAVLSVDTFFMLSGFLTTVLFVREVEKKGGLSFRLMVLYYVHRYIRLTPAFLLMILVSINLTPYFGHGPSYPSAVGFEAPDCRSHDWWTSIVYVGNLVKTDGMCLPITWYLHNDMQFHWIAPLSLIPFALGRKSIGFVLATVLALTGSISILSIVLYYPDMSLNSLSEFGTNVSLS
jgi:peptidoglycan/LPS O-acetylase OafA/YrhL